jgi:hypothetical protein
MRRLRSHISTALALGALALAVQLASVASAWAAPAGSYLNNNPALNQQVQEALAKAQAQKTLGGAAGAGAGTGGSVGSGVGGGGSFSKLAEGGGEEEASREAPAGISGRKTASSTSGPLSTGVVLPLLIVAGGVLLGIAFLILRDARGLTPAGDLLAAASGSAEARAARLRKRRAKAKAARKQRKRNR